MHQNTCIFKIKFGQQFLVQYPNVKFHDDPSNGSWPVPYRRMDRHDTVKSLLATVYNCAQKLSQTKTKQYGTSCQFLKISVFLLH
jgi:hypothetical protein